MANLIVEEPDHEHTIYDDQEALLFLVDKKFIATPDSDEDDYYCNRGNCGHCGRVGQSGLWCRVCRSTGVGGVLAKVLPFVTMDEYVVGPSHMRVLLGCNDRELCTPVETSGAEFDDKTYWPIMPMLLGHVQQVHPVQCSVPRLLLTFVNHHDWGNSKVYFEKWEAGPRVDTGYVPIDVEFYRVPSGEVRAAEDELY